MPTGLRLVVAAALCLAAVAPVQADDTPRLPRVADGWSIELARQAPAIQYPSAIVVAPDGTIYLGQDRMNMPGPVNAPVDSVLAIRPDGSTRVFAAQLHSVMGLEWVDGTLIVVHAPFLSSLRDNDGDGVADVRVDLVTGLGPQVPGLNGLNDHIASGVRLGMDGFLYVSVGDKGIPLARGTDGATITMGSGGVVRVRPDGSNLEVVSTGERNPLSVALTDRDDVWTFGNDDDSHLWPNSLTHHIVGGHYGYPYEFRAAPHRALPIVAGQNGGAGAQGICSNDAGLPGRFRGNLFFCDWGLQAVARYEVAAQGASFRLVRREAIVEPGDLADFRPFSIAPTNDGAGFWVVDWAYNGWLGVGPPSGRLVRLTYTGSDRTAPITRTPGSSRADQVAGLAHPTLAVRLANQRLLAGSGTASVAPLAERLARPLAVSRDADTPRIHALWALDALGTPEAQSACRRALDDPAAAVRAQAARRAGIRRDAGAEIVLAGRLADPDPVVRREAAIALGRLPATAPTTDAALYRCLGERDPTVAWSIRRAIRTRPRWDQTALTAALNDPQRRDSALTLADGSYAPEVVRALVEVAAAATRANTDPAWRARVVAALGGLYFQVPAWNGRWFGSDPASGPRPRATEAWDSASMDAVLAAVARSLRDGDATVRRQAIIACITVGSRATPLLRAVLEPSSGETDPINILAAIRFLSEQRDSKGAAALAGKLADATAPAEIRLAALDALAQLNGPVPINARLMVLYDAASPASLIAHALPALGRAKLLPINDLLGFLDHADASVRAAALSAFPLDKVLTPAVVESILLHGDDPASEVRQALAAAAGRHRITAAIPKLVEWAAEAGSPIRVEAIRALAALPDRRGLPAYLAALDDRDPALRKLGLQALTAIPTDALPELAARAGRGEFVGPSALLVERLLAHFRPLTEYRVIGPFPRAIGPILGNVHQIDFAHPEIGLEGKPVVWQAGRVDSDAVLSLADVGSMPGSDQPDAGREAVTAFAVAEVKSDRTGSALLLLTATGPTIVAVGDRGVASFVGGAASETVRVELKEGMNRILLRTRQPVGPWSIRVEVSETRAGRSRDFSGEPNSATREGLRAFALKRTGDPKNGAALFQNGVGGIGCARCHAVGGSPAAIPGLGPDLTGLALKYDKAEIIRSVLDPSSRIAVGFAPTAIERLDGTVATGLVRGETANSIDLINGDGQTIHVLRDAIAQRSVFAASLMPEGLVDGLKPVEFLDLITYLSGLGVTQMGR